MKEHANPADFFSGPIDPDTGIAPDKNLSVVVGGSEVARLEPNIMKMIEWAPTQLALAQSLEVRDMQSYDAGDGALTEFSADLKTLEAAKEQAVRPLRDVLKQIGDVIDPAIKALKDAKSLLATRLGNYNRKQEAIAKQAQATAVKEAKAAGFDTVVEVKPATAERGTTKYRDHWTFEIEDLDKFLMFCAGSDDHRHLIMPDEKKLRALSSSLKKEYTGIPGLKVFNKRIAVN